MYNEYQEILEIADISYDKSGIYKCRVENAFGQKEVVFHVTVFGKYKYVIIWHLIEYYVLYTALPEILSINQSAIIIEPDELHLHCKAFGAPIPILTWILNGQGLVTTARISVESDYEKEFQNNGSVRIDQYGNGYNANLMVGNMQVVEKQRYGLMNIVGNEVTLDLVIPVNGKKKSGKYSCVAINTLGKDEEKCEVNIYSK